MNKGLAVIAVHLFLISGFAFAQESIELKQKAKSEIQQAGQLSERSTDAQVSGGMLSLKDPMQEIRTRSWDYSLRLSVQSFRPQGTAVNDLSGQHFNLGDASSTVLPSLAIGFELPLLKQTSWSMKWGVEGRGAYTTEKAHARFDTGYVDNDAQLNTTLLSLDPYLRFSIARLPKLSLNLGGEFGSVNYTQSTSNKLASYSAHSSFVGESVGLEYSFTKQASLIFNYVHRETAKADTVRLPTDNFELGTRILW